MNTPAERLCSRSWRLRNSAWMMLVIVLCGYGTWAGFLYIGSKSKNRAWTRAAMVYGAITLPLVVLMSVVSDSQKNTSTAAEKLSAWPLLILWGIGIVHAVRANKQWLPWKAQADSIAPTWSSPQMVAGGSLSPPPPPPQGRVDVFWEQPAPAPNLLASSSDAVVDLNAATLQQLQGQLGLSPDMAIRVLEVRARLGRFSSADQLVTEVGVPPHIFSALRSRVSVGLAGAPSPKPARRLEL